MSNIKKAFVSIHAFLLANQDKKVKSIMDEFTEMCSAKGAGGAATSVHRDSDGNVVAVLDYYFKKWLPVNIVEFGAKATSASGLSTMCKLGTSYWTKQQRDFKKAKDELLDKVSAREIEPTDIQAHLDALEAERAEVRDFPVAGLAFEDVNELLAADQGEMQAAWDAYQASLVTEEAPADEAA